mgnify:CR=1 FL=1
MILDVQDLSFRYSKNAKPIFHNVNLQMEKGEILTILGANGAGKSTLLNILGAIDSATGGKVIANGKNIAGLSEEQLSTYRSKTVGFVFQAFHVISPFFPMAKGLTAYIIRSASEWQFCCIAVAAASSVDPERRNREQK